MRYLLYSILVIVAIAAAAFTIIGIPGHLSRKPPLEVFPDMNRQAKLRPEKPFDFFTNGLSSQLPPAGTVVRSAPVMTVNGPVYSYQDVPLNTGCVTGTTNFVETNPLIVNAAMLQRGPSIAPLDQYLIADRNAEIALARSAAPKSIADNAEVMVLDRQGYKTAAKGRNGFVCMVERSWTAGFGDPVFWNPKIRGPICFNPAAVRTYLPLVIARTRLALAGKSETQMLDAIDSALDKKELPSLEAGAMCYMLSKRGYLGDQAGHWHPHLMFWAERTDPNLGAQGCRALPSSATWRYRTG